MDADGEFFSPIVAVTVGTIAAHLEQNVPNPFNPDTRISFTLPENGHVTLAIYDAAGSRVRVLVDEVRGRGTHDIGWNGQDERGMRLGSGVYFYRLRVGKYAESRKMLLLK